ncbi:MAG: hypothetical protein CM1200mP14_23430 [Gammaproteobacteria bacterium]|nr:MAG: hypothetical protein CM1200mP14_23430 [Gammaproteobacteria bacterium]
MGPFGQEQTLVDPSTVGMSAEGLAKVDSIIRVALADSAASGAGLRLDVGTLGILGAFGELAYGSGRPGTSTSLWDLASVSKVVGTTTPAMILVGEGPWTSTRWCVVSPWWSSGGRTKK